MATKQTQRRRFIVAMTFESGDEVVTRKAFVSATSADEAISLQRDIVTALSGFYPAAVQFSAAPSALSH